MNKPIDTNFSQTASPLREPLQNAAAAAASTGRDVQKTALDLIDASTEILKKEASELMDVAKDIASEAGDKIQNQVGQQKRAGADYVGNLADTMRRAAAEFEADTPIAATYIRKAAAQVDSVSDAVREGDFNDLIRGAQSFAKQQPTAFLGLAVLAGFGAVRFLKSAKLPAATDDAPGSQFNGGGREPDRMSNAGVRS